jgi:hypothetical protein
MQIFNGTAHQINIFTLDQCDASNPRKLIVLPDQQPCYVIPAGTNLNCVKSNKPIDGSAFPFPVKGAVDFDDVDSLPYGFDIYVVSNLYRSAYIALGGDPAKLATVDGVVYQDVDNPRPCGCLGLAIG